jgi:hypothetical protein
MCYSPQASFEVFPALFSYLKPPTSLLSSCLQGSSLQLQKQIQMLHLVSLSNPWRREIGALHLTEDGPLPGIITPLEMISKDC